MKREDALKEKADNENSDADKSASDEDADAEENADGEDDHFLVAWGINRSLAAAERQGFLLIALACAAGVGVLTVLYIKVIRRRKK